MNMASLVISLRSLKSLRFYKKISYSLYKYLHVFIILIDSNEFYKSFCFKIIILEIFRKNNSPNREFHINDNSGETAVPK